MTKKEDLQNLLKKPTQDQEPFFYIDSTNIKENISFIQKNNIKNIYLQEGDNGFNIDNIDFINEIPFVEKLAIMSCPKLRNVEALSVLVDLKQLQLTRNDKLNVDLSNLTALKNLFFGFTKRIKGYENLNNLERIYVDYADSQFLSIDVFKIYKNLLELKIGNSIIENSLMFLKYNINTEYLELNMMKRAFDLDGIQYLSQSLKKLKLISCKKISNVQIVSELINLEWLILSNSVPLEDAAILTNLKKLEALTMFGSSYFINGDLRSLKNLKNKIEFFRVENKKHYYYD